MGKVWKFGDDINTDLVIPNFAVLMTKEEQLEHVFSANRPGWKDEVQPGDVLLAGRNFGVGSARPIGDMFVGLGVRASWWPSRSTAWVCGTASTSGSRPCRARGSSTPSKKVTSPRSTGRAARCATSTKGTSLQGNPDARGVAADRGRRAGGRGGSAVERGIPCQQSRNEPGRPR